MTIYQNTLAEVKNVIQSKSFTDFYSNKEAVGSFVVGALSESDMTILGTESSVVLMSKESLETHKLKHQDIKIDDYRLIPEIIEYGELYQQQNKRYALLHKNGRLYRAAIKTTQDGKEVYFLSLFFTTEELADIQIRKKFERLR